MIDDANDTIIKELFEDTLDHIQSGGLYAIPEILILVSKIASRVDAQLLQEFLSLAKASVFDLRRNVQFWPAFTALVKVLFHTSNSSEVLIEASKEVFEQSETIHGLALVMVKHVEANFTNYEPDFQINFLSDCLTFGPIFKKDQMIFSLTNEFIFHNNYSVNYIEGSDHHVNARVRVIGKSIF